MNLSPATYHTTNDPNHPHWDNPYKPPMTNRSMDKRLDPLTIQCGSLLNLWPQRTENMVDWDTVKDNIWNPSISP